MYVPTLFCHSCPIDGDLFYTSDPAEFVAHAQTQHFIEEPLGRRPAPVCPSCRAMDGEERYDGLCIWCFAGRWGE